MNEKITSNILESTECLCAFLILNYETYWETFNCVESIFSTVGKDKIDDGVCSITIVENGSKNESLKKLIDKYRLSKHIHVISSETNQGFAKGNNIGFKYIKDNYHVRFICMINSDILLTDNHFLSKLISNYDFTKFDVAGPNVVLRNNNRLNPIHSTLLNVCDVDKSIRNMSFRLKMCELHIEPIYAALVRIKNIIFKKPSNTSNEKTIRKLDLSNGEQIHGCFIIFSETYIQKFDGLYPETFLYGEETLLRLRCQRAKLNIWYLPEIKSLHNESQTEKFIGGNINERHKKRFKNMIYSTKVIREYMSCLDVL